MPCDTKLKPKQTLAQRKKEVRKAAAAIDKMLAVNKVQAKIGKQGAIAFVGIPDNVRDGLTDACVYRRIVTSGSVAARQAIAKAERLAGRSVDKRVVAAVMHSHDNGTTWHAKG